MWQGTITNAGAALLSQWIAGGTTLLIDGASGGTGTVDASALPSQTAISGTAIPASIMSAKRSETGTVFKVQTSAQQAAVTLKQMGIFAHIGSGSETLIAIWQNTDGVFIPAAQSSSDFVYNLSLFIAMDNSGELSVAIDTDAYVSNENFQDAVTALSAVATSSSNGMMSAADKAKLDGIADQANKYVHPSHAENTGVPTANQSPAFGGTFDVDQVANDNQGHVTGHTTRKVTMPSATASPSASGLMSKEDKVKLDGVAANANNYSLPAASSSTRGGVKTGYTANGKNYPVELSSEKMYVNVPWTDTTYTGSSPISVNGTTISHANSGVTSGSKGDTSNQTPGFGSTFKALSGTVNATGHLTAFAEHTVKMPNATATQSAAGLMSATDKANLDGIMTSNIDLSPYINTAVIDSLGFTGKMAKIGKVVIGVYEGSIANDITGLSATMFTLPSGYRPSTAFKHRAFTDARDYNASIAANGVATLFCSGTPKPAKYDIVNGIFVFFTA